MATRRDAANSGSRGPTPQPGNTDSNTNASSSNRSDSTGEKRPKNTGKSKGVAWADDEAPAQQQQQQQQQQPKATQEKFTFYREGTPPPLDDDDYQQISLSTGPHDAGAYSYDYSYDLVAPPAPIPQVMICGIRKRRFWIIFGVAVAAVVIAVAVGIGVGVGAKHDSSDANSTKAKALSSDSIHTVTPTSIPVEATQAVLPACPAANNTKYEVKAVSKTFLRLCGVDYTGEGGAVDLGVVWTSSMQDCITSCAGYPKCTACSWGVIPGDAGSDHRCWLKNDLQRPSAVRSGWEFAILQ